MVPGHVPPPLTREELLSLLDRCESSAATGKELVEIRAEDLANLCERLRTLMQIEDGFESIKKFIGRR